MPGLAARLFWATSPQSPAPDRSSSLLGKAAGAGGQDTVLQKHTNGEKPHLWSEQRPAKGKASEEPVELVRRYARVILASASNQQPRWQELRPESLWLRTELPYSDFCLFK